MFKLFFLFYSYKKSQILKNRFCFIHIKNHELFKYGLFTIKIYSKLKLPVVTSKN